MALDSKYIPLNYLQQYFVNKDTGLPLAGGIVTFYKDQARSIKKDVYQLSGSPPNYTYVALPNPLTLSAYGTFQDLSGNDITVYAKPYDDNNNVELYYVTIYSSAAIFQESREAVPNTVATVSANVDITNFVPNGQFLIHNITPQTSTTDSGQITTAITDIAPGGWTFERPGGSVGKDVVLFPEFSSPITNPTGNPRYTVRVENQIVGSGDTYKRVRLKFKDVNRFASSTQYYNLFFYAKSNSASDLFMAIELYKYFGSGGSSFTPVVLKTLTVSTSYTYFNIPFVFGSNLPYTLGTSGDDFVAIDFMLPTSYTFDVSITDVALVIGSSELNQYPENTTNQITYSSIAGSATIPRSDGMDLYLPQRMTKFGLEPDDSLVGKVFISPRETLDLGELKCDGSQYEVVAYSGDGIPYRRLYNKIGVQNGTGRGFFTSYDMGAGEIVICENAVGVTTIPSNGAVSPGFTYSIVADGHADYGFDTYWQSYNDNGFVKNKSVGASANPIGAGTSGFSVGNERHGGPARTEIVYFQALAAAGLAGKYFLVSGVTPTTQDYYVWFQENGSGADPAVPSRTGIKVNLTSTWSLGNVGVFVTQALSSSSIFSINVTAGSTIPAGSYFNVYTPAGLHYVVWYKVDGTGSQPSVSGANGYIEVDIGTTYTAAQVAAYTQSALMSKYFAVPDYRGVFLRGWNESSTNDPDAGLRVAGSLLNYNISNGNHVGSYQFDQNAQHGHTYETPDTLALWAGGSNNGFLEDRDVFNTSNSGGQESRPVNVYVNYVIKY